MRLASATAFDNTISTLAAKQTAMNTQQDAVSAGLRVQQASDDPISAASAERAMSRITQLKADQRALNVQRDSLATAESTLGTAGTLMQRFRELAVRAGNASNNATDRTSMANEMKSIREQMVSLANTKDANGVYLFSGLEAKSVNGVVTPAFTTTGSGATLKYAFNGTAGQNSPTQSAVPFTMDGNATWMQVPKGNGVYDVTVPATNTGQLSTDVGQFSTTPNGGAMTSPYQISFTVTGTTDAPITTYSVNTVPATTPLLTGTYVPGQPIAFSDAATSPVVNVTVTVNGTPANGDAVSVAPYVPASAGPPPAAGNPASTSLFELMDTAINGITSAASGSSTLAQTIAQTLTRMDSGADKLLAARGQAGVWLNRADSINDSNSSKSTQLETDRSNAQDLDYVAGISDLEKLKTGYQVAMQSYAQIQKLSLFDYLR